VSDDPSTELRTDRLVLTPLVESDAAEMVAVLADPTLYAFTGGEAPDRVGLEARYRALEAGSPVPGEDWRNWIIRLVGDGCAVGFVQATVVGDEADVAWVVGVPWQGRGIAREAAGAMCRWLHDRGVGRISAHIHPDHHASAGVAASLGLRATGEMDGDGEMVWSSPP
jgi:RimJ/RimL family protein N-acetyltransferase